MKMKIKIFNITNILAFKKKWASFPKQNIKIIRVKIDSYQLIIFYEEVESVQELMILKESKSVLEKKVNNLLKVKKIACMDISMRKTNSFVAVLVFKGGKKSAYKSKTYIC